jgi:hypothetical protein
MVIVNKLQRYHMIAISPRIRNDFFIWPFAIVISLSASCRKLDPKEVYIRIPFVFGNNKGFGLRTKGEPVP